MKEYKGLKVPEKNRNLSSKDRQSNLCSSAKCDGIICPNCLYAIDHLKTFEQYEKENNK